MPPASRRPRSRQADLFPRSKRAVIEIAPTHRLVMITEEADWTELEELGHGSGHVPASNRSSSLRRPTVDGRRRPCRTGAHNFARSVVRGAHHCTGPHDSPGRAGTSCLREPADRRIGANASAIRLFVSTSIASGLALLVTAIGKSPAIRCACVLDLRDNVIACTIGNSIELDVELAVGSQLLWTLPSQNHSLPSSCRRMT